MDVRVDNWLDLMRKEYLQTFVREGGAAVKFPVPLESSDPKHLKDALRTISQQENYQFALVDAADTRVHMIDQVFHRVAQQVEWEQLAFSFLSRILSQNGYRHPDRLDDFCIRAIAEMNGRDQGHLHNELKGLLERSLFRDYRMCQEYRLAMLRLCQARLDLNTVSPSETTVKEWLTGTLRRISEMKRALIFQKIARHNARHMLTSLSHWTHCAGKSGLVLVLDISRCFLPRPRPKDPADVSIYYSRAAVLDAYEVLRECIDTTDEMEYCFVVVIAPPPFLWENEKRSVWQYEALRYRVWDDVRDEHRANPLSPLVRLVEER